MTPAAIVQPDPCAAVGGAGWLADVIIGHAATNRRLLQSADKGTSIETDEICTGLPPVPVRLLPPAQDRSGIDEQGAAGGCSKIRC